MLPTCADTNAKVMWGQTTMDWLANTGYLWSYNNHCPFQRTLWSGEQLLVVFFFSFFIYFKCSMPGLTASSFINAPILLLYKICINTNNIYLFNKSLPLNTFIKLSTIYIYIDIILVKWINNHHLNILKTITILGNFVNNCKNWKILKIL